MTTDRDIGRILDHWLLDGPTTAPDRVLDVLTDRIEHQPQRPAWRLDRRLPAMNPYIKAMTAIAAVIVVAVIGYNLLPGGQPSVGGPGPTPSPTPAPSVTPAPTPAESPSAVYPSWFTAEGDGAGTLAAGSQMTRQFIAGSTFTVPEGWVNDSDYAPVYTLFPDTPANEAEYALSKETAQDIIMTDKVQDNLFLVCEATGLFQGTTASEVIDFLVANEAFSMAEPVEVTIDGMSGRQVELQLSPDWTGNCPLNENDPPTRDYADARHRLILLDTPVGGLIGITINSRHSSDFEAFLADAMPIVESLNFEF
jgi:hypothetical protein